MLINDNTLLENYEFYKYLRIIDTVQSKVLSNHKVRI